MLISFKNSIKHFYNDSLYRNSVFLMLSTGVMAVFGFVFWIVASKFYTSEQIGIATTLISVSSLIMGFSMLGLNTALIRYLPSSERKNEKINTGFTVVILASIVLSIVFILGLPIFSPKLMFLRQKLGFELLFVAFMIFSSVNALLDSIFIAYRSSIYVFLKNVVWSVLKLSLPIFAVSFGAWGIYSSVSFATIVAVSMSIGVLMYRFNYRPRFQLNKDIISSVAKYSGGNYLAGILGGLPSMLLPLIITNKLGAPMAAYYYMPMMIANLLYVIPQATTRSFFAEGSYAEKDLKSIYNRALKINALLLLPAMMLVYFFGKYVLLVFGYEYAREGTRLLQLMAVSSVFVFINTLSVALLNIRRQLKKLLFLNFVTIVTMFVSLEVFINFKLLGVGISWMCSCIIGSLVSLILTKEDTLFN